MSKRERQAHLHKATENFLRLKEQSTDELVELLLGMKETGATPWLKEDLDALLRIELDQEEIVLKLASHSVDIPFLRRKGLNSMLLDERVDLLERFGQLGHNKHTVFHPHDLHDLWFDLAKEYEASVWWPAKTKKREEVENRRKEIENFFPSEVRYQLFENNYGMQVPLKSNARSLALVTNLYLTAYDYAIEEPEREGKVVHNLLGLLQTRAECLLRLQYDPKLKRQRGYLKARDLWDKGKPLEVLTLDYLVRAKGFLPKSNSQSKSRVQVSYAKTLQDILQNSPSGVNLDKEEALMSDWRCRFRKGSINEPITYASCWVQLSQERWARGEDGVFSITQAASLIYETQRRKKWDNPDWVIPIPMYDLAVQVAAVIEDKEVDLPDMDIAEWYNNVPAHLLQHLSSRLDGFAETSQFLKEGVVFVPVSSSGSKGSGLVVKLGNYDSVRKEFDSQMKMYNEMLALTESQARVPFTRPVGFSKACLDGKEVGFYVMLRSEGKNVSERFRYMGYDYRKLQAWGQQGAIRKLNQNRMDFVNNSIDSLTGFQAAGSRLLERDEIEVDEFDPLENLITRAFVKSTTPGWKNRVKDLHKIIGTEDWKAWNKIDKTEFFADRIPYSSHIFDFLCLYKEFVSSCVLSDPLRVVLHGDAHFNNLLEDGTLIDNKDFTVGHPLFDLEHLLIHPGLQYMFHNERDFFQAESKFIKGLSKLLDEDSPVQFPNTKYFRIHAAICLTGAMLQQGNFRDAEGYKTVTFKSMDAALRDKFIPSSHKPLLLKLRSKFSYLMNDSGCSRLSVQSRDFDARSSRKKKQLRIGIDFDGVCANSDALKVEYARKNFATELEPEDCTKNGAMAKGLTRQQYEQMIDDLYATEESLKMNPIENADVVTADLIALGHEVYIITSRNERQAYFAEQWLEENEVSYTDIHYTSEKTKAGVCQDLEVDLMVDDSYSKLQDIELGQKFLFTTPSNVAVEIVDEARRLDSWWNLYSAVSELSGA